MSNTEFNSKLSINGLALDTIIFDDTEFVTLEARSRVNDQLNKHYFICSVHTFNEILRHHGSKGEAVMLAMADLLLSSNLPPYVINFKQTLGESVLLTACTLNISKFSNHNKHGHQHWFIHDVKPLSDVQQARNIKQHILDFGSASGVSIVHDKFKLDLADIACRYKRYLDLIALDIDVEAAKLSCGLTEERLFKIASTVMC